MKIHFRRCLSLLALLALVVLSLFAISAPAHADGGAPNLAYVAGAKGGIAVVDIASQQVTKTISVPDPAMALLSLDGRFLYVADQTAGKVSLVSANTGSTVCSVAVPGHPALLALDPNAGMLFAGANDAESVTAINVRDDSCKVARTLKIGGPVYGLGVALLGSTSAAGSGNQLWVSTSKALLVFDDIHGQQIANISVPEGPRYISTPVGTAAYVTTNQGTVIAIDFNTHKTMTVLSGGLYGPMDYDAFTLKLYVPDRKHQQLAVINPVDGSFSQPTSQPKPIDLSATPISVAITSDGQFGFVAMEGGKVAMYDIPGRSLTTTIDVGGTPRFIITGVFPPSLGNTPQEASTLQTIATVIGYVVVGALLIVPIVLFRRYAKTRPKSETGEKLDAGEQEDLNQLEAGPSRSPNHEGGNQQR